MRVTVSVFGRFHAFYLAHQLHKRNALDRLITSYPKFEVTKYGIPRSKVEALTLQEGVSRTLQRLGQLQSGSRSLVRLLEWFDKSASLRISPDSDLYVGWSSFSEHGLIKAKSKGAVTVLERGSAHIECQHSILQEEYERLGQAAELPHPLIVNKEKREYDLADYICIPSRFVKETFLSKGVPNDRLIVIPYGVDLSSFKPGQRQDQIFRVIYAGAMSLRKGVHYLLQAFAELNLVNAELWLVGTKLPEIDKFFHRYEGTYRYFGPVPQAELYTYYSQCSVLAICSIEDGFGMVIPQAMACGLPVICTTNTGGDELIEEGSEGFIIPIRNINALKDRISDLFQRQEICKQMGAAARRKVESGLTWDDYGRHIHEAYCQILLKHSSLA